VRGAGPIARPTRRRASGRTATLALLASVLVLCLSPNATRAGSDQVIAVTTGRPRVTETMVVVRPTGKAVASVVVFVGGTGKLDLTPLGLPRNAPNPLVHRREQLAGRGLVVAFVDAPSDRAVEGLLGFRASREHAVDIGVVIARLRSADPVPLWLVGTSMGAVSAANAAVRLGRDGPDGLVLVSSVTRTHPSVRESLRDVPLEGIQAPTLVVHHRHDQCETARYDDASALPSRLTAARRVELVALEGGPRTRGLPCGPESPHAFFGLEDVLIDRLASWIVRTPMR
jgi:predicted alpha/beta-hydrolase family hydrolase